MGPTAMLSKGWRSNLVCLRASAGTGSCRNPSCPRFISAPLPSSFRRSTKDSVSSPSRRFSARRLSSRSTPVVYGMLFSTRRRGCSSRLVTELPSPAPWMTCSREMGAAVSSAGQGAFTHSLHLRRNQLRAVTRRYTDRFLAPTRRSLFKVAQWVFAAVVLFFAAGSLTTQWGKFESRLPHIQFGWEWIFAATAIVLVTYALLIEGWRRILVAWDSHLPFVGRDADCESGDRRRHRHGDRCKASRAADSGWRGGSAAGGDSPLRAAVSTPARRLGGQSHRARDRAALCPGSEHLDGCCGEHFLLAVLRNRVPAVRARAARCGAWRNELVHRSLHRCVHPWIHLAD